jgi:hypothetical protein
MESAKNGLVRRSVLSSSNVGGATCIFFPRRVICAATVLGSGQAAGYSLAKPEAQRPRRLEHVYPQRYDVSYSGSGGRGWVRSVNSPLRVGASSGPLQVITT